MRKAMIGFMIGLMVASTYSEINEYEARVIEVEPIFEEYTLTELDVYEYLCSLNVRFPHIALAQMKCESGTLTSELYYNNNNLFGMKEAKQRPTTAIGTQNGHAHYEDWRQSVVDYALWQARYAGKYTTEEAYYEYLGRVYAQDTGYVKKIKRIVAGLDYK